MKVSLIPVEHVNAVWDVVGKLLEPAVAVTNGRYTTYDVYNAIQRQAMTLWVAFDDGGIHGCQVTQITDYPSKRVLVSVFTAGRKLRSWREPMMDVLMRWARDHDCEAIEGLGREGWVKMMEPYGFKKMLVMFEKDI